MAKVKFFGGARRVTGACYLLEAGGKRILIDCGMFQGSRFAERENFDPFPFDPKSIDFLLVTHAHIDHTGRLPKIVKDGFKGKILSTRPTKDFALLLLNDSADLLKKEAEDDNHEPFFYEKDIPPVFTLWNAVEYEKEIMLGNDLKCIFRDAGHILGSSFIEITFGSKKIVFSGDLGNSPAPLLRPLELVKDADYIITESAYGDRFHPSHSKTKSEVENIIEETFSAKGVLMIPAFAVERTQELLYELNELVEHGRIPQASIFIDSPLALNITDIYRKYPEYYSDKAQSLIKSGDDIFKFPGLKFTHSVDDSKAINGVYPPKLIIAGSGMMQGGRILHHLKRYLSDLNSTLLIVGYQAGDSLGKRLINGAREVKIHGEIISVAAKIIQLSGFSAHADQKAILEWIAHTKHTLQKVFVVQGDEKPALALVQKIKNDLGIDALAPNYKDEFEI